MIEVEGFFLISSYDLEEENVTHNIILGDLPVKSLNQNYSNIGSYKNKDSQGMHPHPFQNANELPVSTTVNLPKKGTIELVMILISFQISIPSPQHGSVHTYQ